MIQQNQAVQIARAFTAALLLVAIAGWPAGVFAQGRPAASTAAARQAYAAAAAFQNEGVLELAAEEWEAFLKRFGTDPLAAEARFNLGACYFKLGKFDQATDAFAIVAEKYPKFDLAETNLLNLGIARFKAAQTSGGNKDRFIQSAAALERFLKQFPKSKDAAQALMLRAEALAAAGKQQEAVASWKELIERHPNSSQHAATLYAVGMGHLQTSRLDEARKMFDRLLRDHADHALTAAAQFELGEYEYHHRKDYSAAAKAYAEAKRRCQDRALAEKIDYKLGWAYYQQRDFAQAQQTFAALTKPPAGGKLAADSKLMLGECLFKEGKYEAAFPHFTQAIDGKLSSDNLAALAMLRSGQCAARLKQWDESLKFFDRLKGEFDQSPYRDEAALERADVLKKLGRSNESLQLYITLAEQTSSAFAMQAQLMVGQLQAENGDHREAVRAFYKVIHGFGDPKSPSPQQNWKSLAIYEAGRSFEALQNQDQARRLYRELIERYPASDKKAAAKERLAELERK
jgi:cellulose synthase operon protein C